MLYTKEQTEEHTEEILGYLYHIALHDSRIPAVLPARVFSEEAALSVRAFQQAYALPVTGEIDSATWAKIVEVYRSQSEPALPLTVFPPGRFVLQRDDRGDLVALIQVLMTLAGHRYENLSPVPVTGVYDDETAAAVRQLQQLSGLPQSGDLDRATWNALAALIGTLPLGS